MYQQIYVLLLLSLNACSEDLTFIRLDTLNPVKENQIQSRSDKYVDVYTNHDDFKDVVDSYYGINRPNHRRFERLPEILHDFSVFKRYDPVQKYSSTDVEDSVHLDRIDFQYPNIEHSPDGSVELESNFGSFDQNNILDNNRYAFLQSQKFMPTEDDEENERYQTTKRPTFKTSKYKPINSYVQKIPRATTTPPTIYENRYEELSISKKKTSPTTRNRINQLLRGYLGKLYNKKYNSTTSFDVPGTLPRLSQEQETKLLNVNSLTTLKNKVVNKINKFFSLFTVVQFNNTECTTSNTAGTYQGVCYTSSQCTTEGGSALGDCANGYGVCCVFIGTCGGSGSQNCTYFQSPNYPDYYPSDGDVVVPTTQTPTTTNPSPTPDPRLPWYFSGDNWARQVDDGVYSCTFNVTKSSDSITKMRIDFEDLELTGPTNGTCSDERLIISGQNANNQIPVICGYNTGQHVYVDVSSLSGPLQITVLSASGARKRFKIKICQFEDTCPEPSNNCLQYYTGVSGVISSFNYDQATMLSRSFPGYMNNLNYAICIRREEGYCSITYRNVVNGVEYPFQLTNVDNSGNIIVPAGQAGADILNCPDDYIVIDGIRLCGDKFNDGSVNDDYTMNSEVTDTGAGPIVIPVRTDSAVTGMGFKLFYTQNSCAGY